MEGREEAVSLCCSSIEQNLSLIGATGVEDKLQVSLGRADHFFAGINLSSDFHKIQIPFLVHILKPY